MGGQCVRNGRCWTVFICSTFIKHASCKKGTKCFVKKILQQQYHEKHYSVTEDKLHDTGTSIETRPWKSLQQLNVQNAGSKSSVHRAIKLLKLCTYKIWAIYNSVSRLGSKKMVLQVVWRTGSQSVFWSRMKHGLY